MRDRLKPQRPGSLKRRTIGLMVVLGLFVSVLLLFFMVDLLAAASVRQRYGPELLKNVQYRTVDGAELAYRQFGSNGPPILLIHGFLGSSHDFSAIWPGLSEQYRVVAVDLIGFGLSDKSTGLHYSKANMARLCGQLMAELGYERYTVLGHSMGGEVSLHMAVQKPEQVAQLVLLNSAGLSDLQQGHQISLPAWLIDGVFKNYLLQRLYFPATVYNRSKADTDAFNRFFFFNDRIPGETLLQLTRDNDSGQLADRLGEISQPALLIWGAEDRIIPLVQGQALAERLPDSRLEIIEECGHLTFLEYPEETLQAILAFLAENG